MLTTINRLFQDSVRRYAAQPALLHKVEGKFQPITYQELADRVRAFCAGLVALGVQRGDHIAMISENRPEWAVADLGMLSLGAVNVPMFTTLPAPQVEYIVADSGAKIIIVSDETQLHKALAVKANVPSVGIITMDCPADPGRGVITFDEVIQRGQSAPLSDYDQRWQSVEPNDLASIIYTSGTTGDPKGVMLSHRNITSNIEAAYDVLRFQPGDVLLSFLPLNHIFERMAGYYLPLSVGATIAYSEGPRRLALNIREVEPHYMMLVPRIYEMFQERMLEEVSKKTAKEQKVFHWALNIGRQVVERQQAKQPVPPWLALQRWLADKLVYRKVRNRLGLRRLQLFVSGGAPLPHDTAEFFAALGITILEGYGLTETSPVVAVNRPGNYKFGTVGLPLRGVEVKIAEDGEICVRGPNVMLGYYNKPKETAEALDAEGWFHTGDIGEFDEDGFLRITDRKKDLIVLANGKNVAPQPIENALKASPYISQVVLLGDKQSTVAALVVPAFERLKQFAQERGIPQENADLLAHPEVVRLFRQEIDRLSTHLADFEKVHRFALLDHEFTIEDGEMTPTLKIRRRVVMERYGDVIQRLYR
ncbi:MAG: long-chain fatty acid--CoA ligase [Abditibacteriales bacterium]|nr:long-chain fatty acid--CoA ligase [Abditibacteriales bacterium]MDW8365150.1 long-chain fatty acid--CoA ligase [Abditibacteriales bacterium]